jgi:hypothetical protein
MRVQSLFTAAAGLALAGCATAPPMSASTVADMRSSIRTVAFVQNGTEPLNYGVGALDGKTSWAGPQMQFQAATSNRADVQGAAAANIVFAVGGAIARESMKDDPDYYPRLMKTWIGERKFTNEVAPRVWPELARAWRVDYDPKRVIVLPNDRVATDKEGVFVGADPGADLVLMYSIEQLMISEKPEMSVLWKSVVTAGMYDRPVVPYIKGRMSVYKREADGKLRRAWVGDCRDQAFLNADFAVQFPLLKAEPQRAGPMFDASVAMAASTCSAALKPILAG